MEALVHITGYAGTEVESKAQGAVAKFRLASTPRVKSKGEWSDGNTTWIEVSCFRLLAEHVASSVRKGDPVVVIGRLRTNVWEKEGQTHERLVLEAETIGHDLNRGTAAFRRRPRTLTPETADSTSRESSGTEDGADQEAPVDDYDAAGPSPEERAAAAA